MTSLGCLIGLGMLSPVPAQAELDLDNNGYGDIWEQTYHATDLPPGEDFDHDGISNGDENLHGSDPRDATSFFGIDRFEHDRADGSFLVHVHVLPGGTYILQSSDELDAGRWEDEQSVVAGFSDSLTFQVAQDPEDSPKLFYRVKKRIKDEDGDGLTAFEEKQLGLDDQDPNSAKKDGRSSGGGDITWVIDEILAGRDVPLQDGAFLPGRKADRAEISRFLNQATFGTTTPDLDAFENSGMSFGEWIDDQLAMAPTTSMASMLEEFDRGASKRAHLHRKGWWRASVTAPDQLRQRMAWALSQILVVSGQGQDLIRGGWTAAGYYYDLLVNGAFGNYADLLVDVTYSVEMGLYLSHFRNAKADEELGVFPDENYAREIMQLFSIGLWELNQDGSLKRGADGELIPTYSNFHIREMARVMTGFNWGGTNSFRHYLSTPALPMTVWDSHHDFGEKELVGGKILPADMDADEEIRAAVENLAFHPNAGPFLGRLLIQRFVTSNPSPEYLSRVASAYEDNGSGQAGDLGATIRAILLDPEARNTGKALADAEFGKAREPYITLVHMVRVLKSANPAGSYPVTTPTAANNLGQRPLYAPSVFNFYLPDYSPQGPIQDAGLVAPEFEIMTPLRMVGLPNYLRRGIESGINYRETTSQMVLKNDFTEFRALVDDPDALIDRLDTLFTYGTLKPETRSIIKSAMNHPGDPLSVDRKLHIALYLVMTSPEYLILR